MKFEKMILFSLCFILLGCKTLPTNEESVENLSTTKTEELNYADIELEKKDDFELEKVDDVLIPEIPKSQDSLLNFYPEPSLEVFLDSYELEKVDSDFQEKEAVIIEDFNVESIEVKKNDEKIELEILEDVELEKDIIILTDEKLESTLEEKKEILSLEDKNKVQPSETKKDLTPNVEKPIVSNKPKIIEKDIKAVQSEKVIEDVSTVNREVTMFIGQILEVNFPSDGWVYIGESIADSKLYYQDRKFITNETIFLFKALNEGSVILKFSRYDVLKDNYVDDFIKVEILHTTEKQPQLVRAPEFDIKLREDLKKAKAAVVKDLQPTQKKEIEEGKSYFDEPELTYSSLGDELELGEIDDEYLKKINKDIEEGKIEESLIKLSKYFSSATNNLDEAWFLQGKAYEQNGPNKNILKALDSYTILTETYPNSIYWNDAEKRIRYIKKMYLQTR